MHDADIALPHQRSTAKLVPLRRKGIASPVKPPSVLRPISKISQVKKFSTSDRIVKPIRPMDHRAKQDAAGKAGQRFRNLSHMNNFRKKARQEPPPNISSDRLRSVEDFSIGREAAHILPVVLQNSSDHDDSSLFIPESDNSLSRRELSPARSESVLFPPAKVDHQSTAQKNQTLSKPSRETDRAQQSRQSKTLDLPPEKDIGHIKVEERSNPSTITASANLQGIPVASSKQLPTPTSTTTVANANMVSNGLSKHRSTPAGVPAPTTVNDTSSGPLKLQGSSATAVTSLPSTRPFSTATSSTLDRLASSATAQQNERNDSSNSSDHRVVSAGAISALSPTGSSNTISNDNIVHPVVRGFHTLPPTTFPLAPLPPPSSIFHAKNGRSWYRGDVMCTFTMGGPIGDAAVIHLPHHPYGAHLVALKVGPVLNLHFEPNPYNMREFEEAFRNVSLSNIYCITANFDSTTILLKLLV